jgi:hypothetical protein
MKKLLLITAVFIGLFFAGSVSDSNAQALGFYLTNNTGFTLSNIYVSPAESNKWGEDILPRDLFENGTSVEVFIPAEFGETCVFDIKITDLEGDAVIFTNVDACKLYNLSLNDDGTFSVLDVDSDDSE